MTSFEGAIGVVHLEEGNQKDDQHKSLHNDANPVEENRDEDACNLSVHDHNLPEVVVRLVPIVEETEFLPDILDPQAILVLPHQHQDSKRDAQSPAEKARRG